jgi:hypothetical protein
MKKCLVILLLVTVLLIGCADQISAEEKKELEPAYKDLPEEETTALVGEAIAPASGCADVNHDGIVGRGDVERIVKWIKKGRMTEERLALTDVNFDGVTNVQDVVLIVKYVNGEEATLNCPLVAGEEESACPEGFLLDEDPFTDEIICKPTIMNI